MKRLFLFLISVVFVSAVYSQDMQIGAAGGLNLSGAIASQPGSTFHGPPGLRFALGGFMDMALSDKRFSFRPSLLFSRQAESPNTFGFKTTVAISYINIPLTFIYHSELLEKKAFFGLGPYLAYALSGRYTTHNGTDMTTSIAWGSDVDQDDAKRFDFGIDILAGYELQKNLILTAKFDFGLNQIATSDAGLKVHTLNFGITCGYFLWSRK